MTEPLPCPFCGSEPEVEEKQRCVVSCPNLECHATPVVAGRDREIAIAKWNKRDTPTPAALQARAEAAEADWQKAERQRDAAISLLADLPYLKTAYDFYALGHLSYCGQLAASEKPISELLWEQRSKSQHLHARHRRPADGTGKR